jgi:hypothetical protein
LTYEFDNFSGATGDGFVSLWDLGKPFVDFDEPTNLYLVDIQHTVHNIVWSGPSGWLLAGTDRGLVGLKFEDEQLVELKEEYT